MRHHPLVLALILMGYLGSAVIGFVGLQTIVEGLNEIWPGLGAVFRGGLYLVLSAFLWISVEAFRAPGEHQEHPDR